MIAVIIAGGSGTRLWPLSTHNHPKQLLKVDNDPNSLLQNTYARAKRLADTVYVLPEKRLNDVIQEQIPDLTDETLIAEPALRGTGTCLVGGLAHVAKRHDADEPVVILWTDHYIRDLEGFVHSFEVAAQASRDTGRVVLVGIEPTYASTGVGYIEKGDLLSDKAFVFNVKQFKEKPELKLAQDFVRSGNYLWNAGYAVGSVNTFTKAMQSYAPELYGQYQQLLATKTAEEHRQVYLGLETQNMEKSFTERVPDLLVVPATFDWMDIGSFKDLAQLVDADDKGNYTKGSVEIEEVTNSFIHNDGDKPVAVIGLDNIVVVNTEHGILVAPKDRSQEVGVISKRLNDS